MEAGSSASSEIDANLQPVVLSRASSLRAAGKHLKPILFGATLLAAVAAVMTEANSVSSNAAVISAKVTTVRAPIRGTFATGPIRQAQAVAGGALLGTLADPRVNALAEQVYTAQAAAAYRQAAAIAEERNALLGQRAALAQRARAHSEVLAERVGSDIQEEERKSSSRQASLEYAQLSLDRGRELFQAGILSRADYDRAIANARVAEQDLAAQDAELSAKRVEAAAARRGIMVETGNNSDVAYSLQRMDEIDLRLADLAREQAEAEAQAAAARMNYGPTAEHDKLLSEARLLAPASGELWKWYAANGEQIGAGERVAELVDCRESFLLASFPQDRVPAIEVGAAARYRLSGEQAEYEAHVTSIDAEQPAADEPKLAARPIKQNESPAVLVRLALDSTDRPRGCAVGRTASVVIRSTARNAASTLFERYF